MSSKVRYVEGFGKVLVEVLPSKKIPKKSNHFSAKSQYPSVLR